MKKLLFEFLFIVLSINVFCNESIYKNWGCGSVKLYFTSPNGSIIKTFIEGSNCLSYDGGLDDGGFAFFIQPDGKIWIALELPDSSKKIPYFINKAEYHWFGEVKYNDEIISTPQIKLEDYEDHCFIFTVENDSNTARALLSYDNYQITLKYREDNFDLVCEGIKIPINEDTAGAALLNVALSSKDFDSFFKVLELYTPTEEILIEKVAKASRVDYYHGNLSYEQLDRLLEIKRNQKSSIDCKELYEISQIEPLKNNYDATMEFLKKNNDLIFETTSEEKMKILCSILSKNYDFFETSIKENLIDINQPIFLSSESVSDFLIMYLCNLSDPFSPFHITPKDALADPLLNLLDGNKKVLLQNGENKELFSCIFHYTYVSAIEYYFLSPDDESSVLIENLLTSFLEYDLEYDFDNDFDNDFLSELYNCLYSCSGYFCSSYVQATVDREKLMDGLKLYLERMLLCLGKCYPPENVAAVLLYLPFELFRDLSSDYKALDIVKNFYLDYLKLLEEHNFNFASMSDYTEDEDGDNLLTSIVRVIYYESESSYEKNNALLLDKDFYPIVQFLLNKGVSPTEKNNLGESAYDIIYSYEANLFRPYKYKFITYELIKESINSKQ